MIRAVKADRKSLVARYGISARLAGRIEALARRDVGITSQALEACGASDCGEDALMLPEVLRKAELLNDKSLAKILASVPGSDQMPKLRIVPQGARKIIALASEIDQDDNLLPSTLQSGRAALQVLGGTEAAELFTRQDIARLKLVIITSTDEDEKITAIRQLALVPADPRDKGAVLLQALRDESAKVRSESARALVSLGLTPEIADAARSLAHGNDSQRILAAQRITSLIGGVRRAEIGVLLTLLAGSLNGEESIDVRLELIGAAQAAVPMVSATPEHCGELVRILLDQVRTGITQLRRPVSEVLRSLGRAEPEVVGGLCWQEFNGLREPAVRQFLLAAMGQFVASADMRKQIVAQAVQQMLASPRPEEDCLELGSILCRWPDESAQPMIDALESAPDAAKLFLVRLLDETAVRGSLSDRMMERIGRSFLRLLQVSEKNVRPAILHSETVHSERLSDALRGELAAEMLSGLGSYAGVRLLDSISNAIVRIGRPALEPLCELLRGDSNSRVRSIAAEMLGRTVAAIPKGRGAADVVRGLVEEALEMLDDPEIPTGAIARALGRMCVNPLAGRKTIEQVAGQLRSRVKAGPEAFGVLAGLGELPLNPATPLQVRLDVVQRFFDLLTCPLPDVNTKETVVDDQRVYSFGGEEWAYTEMVPVALAGIENSYLGTDNATLRDRVVKFLIAKWAEISSSETIWGPDSVISLLRVMGSIACDSTTETDLKLDVVAAISTRTDLIHTVETLGSIYRAEPGSARLGAKARDLAWHLIERRLTKRSLPVEDRQIIHQVLGLIGSRSSLGSDPALARRTRERIVETLFGGLREGFAAAASALATMKDCPALPSAVRKDISERLAAFETAHSGKVPFRSRPKPQQPRAAKDSGKKRKN